MATADGGPISAVVVHSHQGVGLLSGLEIIQSSEKRFVVILMEKKEVLLVPHGEKIDSSQTWMGNIQDYNDDKSDFENTWEGNVVKILREYNMADKKIGYETRPDGRMYFPLEITGELPKSEWVQINTLI